MSRVPRLGLFFINSFFRNQLEITRRSKGKRTDIRGRPWEAGEGLWVESGVLDLRCTYGVSTFSAGESAYSTH